MEAISRNCHHFFFFFLNEIEAKFKGSLIRQSVVQMGNSVKIRGGLKSPDTVPLTVELIAVT